MHIHHSLIATITLATLSTALSLPDKPSSGTINRRFLSGNCAVLWNSAIWYNNPMDFYVLEANDHVLHHDNKTLVPEYPAKPLEFDCGLDVKCVIQAEKRTYPTFRYKAQVITMPAKEGDILPLNSFSGGSAAPLCGCSMGTRLPEQEGEGWIMCTFACGNYGNACPRPGMDGEKED